MAASRINYLLLLTLASVSAIQMMFDQFRHCTSNGMVECNLRVRKINRTVAALYGNATLKVELGDSFVASASAYYSTLGNNQYNLYPLRIAPISPSTFLDKFWGDYYGYFENSTSNLPRPHECPVTAREIHFNDLILDGRMVPQYAPTGLWKLVVQVKDTKSENYFVIEVILKVFPDGYL